ncbi:dihydrofolate reductase [Brevundimonas aveniformis]|uniref:dihydrofolate reductase n=1 Tax=Brevundimonas aveniformis TaxID=370977 RepID=UPI0003FA3039|nr:dihydrofolate reductase [Brevundimonas aveniformis]
MTVLISLVAARGRNGVIGSEGALPWRLRSDLQKFKQTTIGKPCVMGRKTWDSLQLRPLPGRLNLVVSRNPDFAAKGALVCATLDEALSIARETAREDGVDEVCAIGGAQIYALALPKARRLYISEVDADPAGDARFPDFDEADWREVSAERVEPGEKDDHAFTFRVLDRR